MKSKERKIKELVSGFAFRMISGIILWFLLFTIIVSTIGYMRFTESLTEEYNDSAFRTAESAAMLVNGDKIDEYLEVERGHSGEADLPFADDEYSDRWERMNILCQKQNVTLIYVIKVDTSLSVEDRDFGGLGILMVKEMSSNLSYVHENGYNVLTVTMQIDVQK
jgi:hypothetical protein